MNTTQIALGVLILLGTLAGAWFTRGSAKDTLGVQLVTTYIEKQEQRILEVKEDLTAVKTENKTLRSTLEATVRTQRRHQRWDDVIYDQAVAAGWDIPPPPPLEPEETA